MTLNMKQPLYAEIHVKYISYLLKSLFIAEPGALGQRYSIFLDPYSEIASQNTSVLGVLPLSSMFSLCRGYSPSVVVVHPLSLSFMFSLLLLFSLVGVLPLPLVFYPCR